MKSIVTIIMLSFGLVMTAQVKKNVTEENKTTKVTVNDGSDPKTLVKTEKKEATQNIELQDANSKKLNKDIKQTPVEVKATTTISGDGIQSQTDRLTYYEMNGRKYTFVSDKAGYRIASPDNNDYGLLRKTSNNNYIYRTKDKTSIGYFDANGNFVVETYDDKTDGITVETYTRMKQ
jgi:hypothetical protein